MTNQSKNTFDQRGQTVYNQKNVAGDLVIALPPISPTTAAPPRPPEDFVGRTEQLEQLTAALTAGQSAAITALQGMGGIGKTALAQQLADQLKPHFSGGIFWAGLEKNNGSAESILRAWGRVCGVDLSQEADVNALSQIVRNLLAMRQTTDGPILAVIDDVRDQPETWLAAALLLKESLPAGVPLLLTTRQDQIAAQLGASKIERLDLLPEADARSLLNTLVQQAKLLHPAATVDALLKALGYLPLAIRLAAGYLNGSQARKPNFKLASFVAQIETNAAKLIDTQSAGLEATFQITYNALNADQQRSFRYASVYSANLLTVEHVGALLQLDEGETESLLDALGSAALLNWVQEQVGRYTLHPMLRQYSYKLLEESDAIKELHRHAAAFLHKKLSSKRVCKPEEGLEEVEQWDKAVEWTHMAQSAHKLVGSLDRIGYWPEIDQCLAAAQHALQENNMMSDLNASLYLDRATLAYRQGQWEKALRNCQQSLQAHEHLNDPLGLAKTSNVIGTILTAQGKFHEAVDTLNLALKWFDSVEDAHGSAQILNNLGEAYRSKNQRSIAARYYKQSLALYEEIDDSYGMASAYNNLGAIHKGQGEWDKAFGFYSKSIPLFEKTGHLHEMGINYYNIGSYYQL